MSATPRMALEPLDGQGDPIICDGRLLRIGRGIRAVRDEVPGEALLDIDSRYTTVSREHATLRMDAGGLLLETRGKHGTTVNGQAVEAPRAVADGDILQFGEGGPRFRLRLRAGGDQGVRRCSGCREIVPLEELEAHERSCEVLRPPSAKKKVEAPSFQYGTLRSTKKNLLVMADQSGGPEGKGFELELAGPGLIDALQGAGLRFNILGFGGGDFELWRGPAGRLHLADDETRMEASAWLRKRGRTRSGRTPTLAQALDKAKEFRGVDALIILAAAATDEIGSLPGVEIHAVGLGPLYYADSKAQAILRDLAARHGGSFVAIAAKD
jgi:hypothetical protein